jgi:hypothetical protein
MRIRYRLGGWESLDMVSRYTRSVKFEDVLEGGEMTILSERGN